MPRGDPDAAPHPIDVHVGRRVAERRLALRYNQSELGRALGLTFQQVQKYEKGTNRISASKLWLIAQFLGVELSYFFDGLPTDGPTPDAPEAISAVAAPTRQSIEISSRVVGLPVAQQKLVLELVRSMASAPREA
jgi:transcriptional regulator with XRE-family HTH domain